jgi:hypothetical protein
MVPTNGIGKERSDVYSLSHLYVAAHLDEQRNRAAQERLAARKPSTRTVSIRATVRSVWSLISGPADRPMTLPTLNHYPYRG